MLTTFIRAFRTPDLRSKILFTLGMVILFRFGASLPTPGLSEQNVMYCSGLQAKAGGSSSVSVFAILNLLSGNALQHLTVFALGIMPYISPPST